MDNSFNYTKWSIENDEDFRDDFEEYIAYWEKEAEGFKNREITNEDSHQIWLNFKSSMLRFYGDIQIDASSANLQYYRKLKLLENKIENSLAIARSNYRSAHKNILERLIDNIGGFFNIFGKKFD